MYKLNVTSHFASAHKLVGYEGLCKNLHGHNWKVQAKVSCTEIDSIGMVMDFHQLKQYVNSILDTLDIDVF